jgi:hypothetical protein
MDVGEAECFEPPRGSRAEVSLDVLAVDDDRPVAFEHVFGVVSREVAQRQTDGARNVLIVVLVAAQDFDDLGALSLELPDSVALDVIRHGSTRRRGCATEIGIWRARAF